MKMATRKTFILVLILCIPVWILAQIDLPKSFKMEKLETKLNFAGQWQNNKVMLKWIPDNIELLRFGQQYGFKVERCNYSSDLKESFDKYEYEELTQSPILPWSVTKLENYLNANPDFIGTKDYENLSLAYELTIGADSIASSRFAADILSNKDAFSKAVNSQNYNYIITILTAAFSNIAAEAIGLFCIDDSIKNGIKYIYKLSLIKNDSNIDVSPSYVVIENTINFTNKPSIKVKEGEKSISLLWDKANDYLAYNVYYSSNNKISFKKANSVPILNNNVQGYEGPQFSSFSKDSLVNFQEYHFIVKGLNFFGDEIEIGTAKGTPKDLTAPERPILFNVIHKEPKLAKIEWKQLCDSIEVWGYKIYRSESLNGKYSIIHDSIIPANWRSFNDSYFDIDTSNYYIVSAIDIYGNQSYSDPLYLTLVDSVPPAMPKPILGKMDSLGIVTLKMENQTEKDFMGYRIYKANADDHEFSVVQETYNDTIVVNARNTTIIDTSTLESLTKYVYYKITALDYHYNESKFSPIIKVKRPDKIRPTSPLISDVNLTAAGVTLTVTLSSSEDVVVNNVFKRVKG